MLRVALDENFNKDIVRGVLRQVPEAQFLSTLGAGLKRATDPEVLAWAAAEGCILLTHDVATMTKFAYDRVRDGLRCRAYSRSAITSCSPERSTISS